MITRRLAAIAVAALLCAGPATGPGQAAAAAHRRRRHLRAARHAQAGRRHRRFPDRRLHRGGQAHEARHHHRFGELLDAHPRHAGRPLRLHRRADDGDQGAGGEHAVHRGLSVDRLPVRHQEGHAADQGLGRPQGQVGRRQQGHALRDALQADGREVRLHRAGLRHPARCHAGRAVGPRLRHARRQHHDRLCRDQEPAVRGRPRAQGHARPLGRAGAEEQSQASCRAAGRARLHEEGRHHGQVLREVVQQEARAPTTSPSSSRRATACRACRATTRRRTS